MLNRTGATLYIALLHVICFSYEAPDFQINPDL